MLEEEGDSKAEAWKQLPAETGRGDPLTAS